MNRYTPSWFGRMLVLGTVLGSGVAQAADRFWTGGDADDDLVSSPDNWGGAAPAAGDALLFLGDRRLTPVNDFPADTSFSAILFSNAVFNGYSGGFSLSGNRVTLGGNIDAGVAPSSGWTGSITDSLALDLVLNNNRTITSRDNFSVSHHLRLTGVISESGAGRILTKEGGGDLWLLGTNTFTGQMRINRATVYANTLANKGTPCSLGSGASTATIRMGNGDFTGTLEYIGDSNASTDRQPVVGATGTGGATIRANGKGSLTFTAAKFNSQASSSTANRLLTLGGGTNAGPSTILGEIQNNPGYLIAVTKADAGEWVLAASNTFGGAVSISGGTLTVKHSAALGPASSGTAVASGATLALDGSAAALDIAEGLSLKGTGHALSLGALQSRAGNNVCRGAITLGENSTIACSGGSLTLDVPSGNAVSGAYNLSLRADGGDIAVVDPINISTSTLTKAYGSKASLYAPSTYGDLKIQNGILETTSLVPDAPLALGNGSNTATLRYMGATDVMLTGGLKLGFVSASDGSSTSVIANESAASALVLTGGVTITPGSTKTQVLRLAGSNTCANAVSGAIADGAAGQQLRVEKSDAGLWTLSGENTYSGGTTVNGGTLLIETASGSGTGSGSVTVTNAVLGGSGAIAGAVTARAGSVLAPDGTLTCGGSLTLAAGTVCRISVGAASNDRVAVAGALNLQGPGVVVLSLSGQDVPQRIPLFTCGSLSGADALPAWQVQGINTNTYVARVVQDGSGLAVITGLRGLLFGVK